MVSPYLKNKGSAVRFCLWPLVNYKKQYEYTAYFEDINNV